jgi:hypothetical protein
MTGLRLTSTQRRLAAAMLNILIVAWVEHLMSTPADAVDKSLFTDVSLPAVADVAHEATAVRSRVVEVNFEALAAAKGAPKAAFDGGSRLGLNLFTDMALTAILERLEERSPHDFTWVGRVEGDNHSHVTLVVKDQVIVGNIRLPKALYQVRYAGHGRHIISEHTYEDPFPHQDPIPVALPAHAPPQGHDALLADDGLTIDLLVVYTAAARAAAQGTTAMQALIELAVSETNTSYDNSDVAQRLRLVRTAEVAYTETGDMFKDLERLRQPADGFMDNVHTLRDTSGADVVALLVERASYCGLGYLMQTPSRAFADYAFGVVRRSCATGNYSFGHELGHMMGCDHDKNNSSGGGSYPYSFESIPLI